MSLVFRMASKFYVMLEKFDLLQQIFFLYYLNVKVVFFSLIMNLYIQYNLYY